jgi:hypothetical protein
VAAIISGYGTVRPVLSVREKWEIQAKGNFGREQDYQRSKTHRHGLYYDGHGCCKEDNAAVW